MTHELGPLAQRQFGAIAIGASAGGIDALFTLLAPIKGHQLPPVIIVLHLPPDHESRLPEIFGARLHLRVAEARPGESLATGWVYFAPPGYHLLVEPDRSFSLSCDPAVNYSRPSIDVLFESCAEAFGPALLAIVLTGANDDGAQGLLQVRQRGGLAIVQSPQEAQHSVMPDAALAQAGADRVLPLASIREFLATLAGS